MLRSKVTLALLALAVIALAIPALSLAGQNTTELEAKLKGKNEVPGPGSPKGKGEIHVFVKPTQQKVCFDFEVSKLDPIVAGHIHKGDAETAGPVKVTLFEDETGLEGTGNYEGCVKNLKKTLLKKIIKAPEKFYVNLHTLDYPDGAIRGQLALTSTD
jgi:CHRD domain-containing protein